MLTLLLAACTGKEFDPGDVGVDTSLPKSDTFPSFYGDVPKNLLVVSVDTTRRDLFTRYGGVGYAPFMEQLMANGVTLDRHRSCSDWTFPSILCATEGFTNIEGGFVPDLHDAGEPQVPDTARTLASRLHDNGYHTMLVTSNSWFSADHNSDIGFESSERPDDRRTAVVFSTGLQRLDELKAANDGAPWYLHLHIKEPHPPYNPPDAYLDELDDLPEVPYDFTDSDSLYDMHDDYDDMTDEEKDAVLQVLLVRYHAEVRWMDDQLSEAFADLDRGGYLDDTLVMFWSDHGEQFWEHGYQTHAYGLDNEENDAIAFFWAKNMVPDSWGEATSHIDLPPTVMSVLGVDDTDGMTGLPVSTAPPDRALDMASAARLGIMQSIVREDWKLIYRWSTGERWLYDTANDPTELDNLYTADDPIGQELSTLLEPKTEALEPLAPLHSPN